MNTDKLLYLALFAPLLPLSAAFINSVAALILAGLAWAALLGVIFNLGDDPQKCVFVAQIPFLMLITYVSFVKARRSATSGEDNDSPEEKAFRDLQAMHRSLKEAVLGGEKQESL